jgi:hypothetical protein
MVNNNSSGKTLQKCDLNFAWKRLKKLAGARRQKLSFPHDIYSIGFSLSLRNGSLSCNEAHQIAFAQVTG